MKFVNSSKVLTRGVSFEIQYRSDVDGSQSINGLTSSMGLVRLAEFERGDFDGIAAIFNVENMVAEKLRL
jgi:hypothetical protein